MPKYTKTNCKIYETKDLKIKSNSTAEKWYCIDGKKFAATLKVLGQSDVLEDLMDSFVVVDKEYRRTIFPDSGKETLEKILKDYNPNIYYIFGCIWTQFGLKFVSRVYSNGELKLYKSNRRSGNNDRKIITYK